MKSLSHHLVPDLASCAVFCELFKEIAVGVEEERQTRRELVDIQTGATRPFDVLDAVIQGEGEFLKRGRAGFANVVTADGDRIPLRNMLRAEFERVDDE